MRGGVVKGFPGMVWCLFIPARWALGLIPPHPNPLPHSRGRGNIYYDFGKKKAGDGTVREERADFNLQP